MNRSACMTVVILAIGLSVSTATYAQRKSGTAGDAPKAKVKLLSAVEAVEPGEPFEVGLQFQLTTGWHIYWKNGGDAGAPPRVSWTLPAEFESSELLFPVPKRYVGAGDIVSNIHDGEPMLLATITPPRTISEGKVALAAKGKYLICKKTCIWQHYDEQIILPVLAKGSKPKPANARLFAAARKALPRKQSSSLSIKASLNTPALSPNAGFDLLVTIDIADGYNIASHDPGSKSLTGCDLFVERVEGVYFERPVYPKPAVREWPGLGTVAGYSGSVVIRVPAETDEEPVAQPTRFGGVLCFQACTDQGKCSGREAVEWSFTVPEPQARANTQGDSGSIPNTSLAGSVKKDRSSGVGPGEPGGSQPAAPGEGVVARGSAGDASDEGGPALGYFGRFGIAGLLIACFLYGLVLNATPCVLPLLSIKILGFVQQAHESRRRTLLLGLAFGAGVMLFFVLLGFLASTGRNVLQYPAAVIVLGAVVMALALSMLGVFTLQVPTAAAKLDASIQKEGVASSFAKGALAPVLGFACTGPMLAAAFGWATQQPPKVAVFAFLFAGLGMASPYVLLGANPNWLSFLPKPGNWMITFERLMGFLLLAMVIWLLHPLVPQIGAEGLEWTLAFLVAIGLGCWLLGKIDLSMTTAKRWTYRGAAAAVVAVAGLLVYGWIYPLDEALARQKDLRQNMFARAADDWSSGIPWRPWSPQAVQAAAGSGRTVFVDFTASWCTVCKVNKKVATNTLEVRERMKALGVVAFQGDFTTEDPQIGAILKTHNRAGVPLNLIYPAGRPDDPIVLRTNLTKQYLLQKLDQAGPSRIISVSMAGK